MFFRRYRSKGEPGGSSFLEPTGKERRPRCLLVSPSDSFVWLLSLESHFVYECNLYGS